MFTDGLQLQPCTHLEEKKGEQGNEEDEPNRQGLCVGRGRGRRTGSCLEGNRNRGEGGDREA